MEVLKRSSRQRRKAATSLNYASSRSHSVFAIRIHWQQSSVAAPEKSCIYFIDLAGKNRNTGLKFFALCAALSIHFAIVIWNKTDFIKAWNF